MSEARWTIGDGRDGQRVVAVRGDFDIASEQPFLNDIEPLLADGTSGIALDLSGVEFMDSTGVRVLVVLRDRFGPRVVVGALSEPVRTLFVTAGVLDWLSNGADPTSESRSDRGTR
jgi:anti-anti-sigma factor